VSANRGKKPGSRRKRRTAEQARREILDAAEKQLSRTGPDSIRLQDVARAVGVSHPTVLHHFGSREGLVQAVMQRASENLQGELVRAFEMPEVGERETLELLDRVFRTLGDRGFARLLAWLMLSGQDPPATATIAPIRIVAEAAHEHGRRRFPEREADFEDTLFTTLMAAFVLFGDAVVGDALRASAGLTGDRDAPKRFRSWLAKLIIEHVEGRPSPAFDASEQPQAEPSPSIAAGRRPRVKRSEAARPAKRRR
jgi:AcrR family transcriptional regulator